MRHDFEREWSQAGTEDTQMLLIKACPRCHGDVSPFEDFEGDLQLSCVQCGHTAYIRRGARPAADPRPIIATTLRRAS
jgi:hypothetical protein